MAIDRYTKVVLTVIAVCLVWLSIGGPTQLTPVSAQSGYQTVVIAGWVDGNKAEHTLPPSGSKTAPVPVIGH